MPELPQAQDATGPQTGEVSGGVFAGLVLCEAPSQAESKVAAHFHTSVQPRAFSVADKRELMSACKHETPDSSGQSCAICKKCLHRNITIERSRATCRDCNRRFIGW